jgi:hypothetical protein
MVKSVLLYKILIMNNYEYFEYIIKMKQLTVLITEG